MTPSSQGMEPPGIPARFNVLIGNNDNGVTHINDSATSPCSQRELWRTTDDGDTWERIAPRGVEGGDAVHQAPKNPVDMVWRRASPAIAQVTFSDNDDPKVNGSGTAWRYYPGGNATDFTQISTADGGRTDITGALYTDNGSFYYCLNTSGSDVCPRNNTAPARAGIWRLPISNAPDTTKGWIRVDAGNDWEVGMTSCGNAMGSTLSNPANSISGAGSAVGLAPETYWVTAMNVWRYGGTTAHGAGDPYRFITETSNNGPYFTNRLIDNVNCTALYIADENTVWAGFYDIGLWKWLRTNGGWWSDQNNNSSTDWGGNDNWGGNVNSILKVGTAMYVVDAKSSKSAYDYRIWKSVNGGSWSKLSNQPPIDNAGANDTTTSYLRSLAYDSNTSTMFASCNGAIFRSVSEGPWVSCEDTNLPKVGMWTVESSGGTTIAGGKSGVYRSTNGGVTWSANGIALGMCDESGSNASVTSGAHKELFHGLHSLVKAGGSKWFGAAYVKRAGGSSPCSATHYGLLYSPDDGVSWYNPYQKNEMRGVAVDSSDIRVYVTEGVAFSSGPDAQNEFDASEGVEIVRSTDFTQNLTPATAVQPAVKDASYGTNYNPHYRNPFGARVAAMTIGTGETELWVSVPGYGVMVAVPPSYSNGGCYPDPCEIEGRTGGDGSSAHRSREETAAPRTVFSAHDAVDLVRSGRLELFDVSGRRATEPKPGVYFSVTRSKLGAITGRRMVVVTR